LSTAGAAALSELGIGEDGDCGRAGPVLAKKTIREMHIPILMIPPDPIPFAQVDEEHLAEQPKIVIPRKLKRFDYPSPRNSHGRTLSGHENV
jgi:hypothetical protein